MPVRNENSSTSIDVNSASQYLASDNGVLLDYDKTEVICCPGGYSGSYTVPSTVTQIDEYAFYLCKKLTGVVLPLSLKAIRTCAFTSCYELTEIVIPENVTLIGKNAFLDCTSLERVISRATKVPTFVSDAFTSTAYKQIPLYVPAQSALSYASASYWKKFTTMWKIGDVNKDGDLNVTDLSVLVAFLLGKTDEEVELIMGDVNYDQNLTATDVTVITSILVGN